MPRDHIIKFLESEITTGQKISDNESDVSRQIENFVSHFPDNIRVDASQPRNKYAYTTVINSAVTFIGETLMRSTSYDTIYMDEVDDMKDFGDIYLSLVQCVSTNGKIIISSTPRKNSCEFHKLWKNQNLFDKLEVKATSCTYNKQNTKTLSSLTIEDYTKILQECVI